jgi:hypothetical protein
VNTPGIERMRSCRCSALVLAPVLAGAALLWPAASVRAELPPWVYGQEQRGAPLRLELEVVTVQRWPALRPDQLLVLARVLSVVRQPHGSHLRPGDALQLRYPLPALQPGGWAGPAPLPLLTVRQRVPAWLKPDPALSGVYRPAAGGRSFGPSLEDIRG